MSHFCLILGYFFSLFTDNSLGARPRTDPSTVQPLIADSPPTGGHNDAVRTFQEQKNRETTNMIRCESELEYTLNKHKHTVCYSNEIPPLVMTSRLFNSCVSFAPSGFRRAAAAFFSKAKVDETELSHVSDNLEEEDGDRKDRLRKKELKDNSAKESAKREMNPFEDEEHQAQERTAVNPFFSDDIP